MAPFIGHKKAQRRAGSGLFVAKVAQWRYLGGLRCCRLRKRQGAAG